MDFLGFSSMGEAQYPDPLATALSSPRAVWMETLGRVEGETDTWAAVVVPVSQGAGRAH